jgi:hypothetical protein
MRRIRKTCMVLWAGLLTVSCGDDDNPIDSSSIRGSGTPAIEVRTLSDFHEIALSAVGTINVSRGAPQSVTVTVDDNIMPYVETVVGSGRLEVRIRSGITATDYDLTVDLVIDSLSEVQIGGVGTVSLNDRFTSDDFAVAVSGVGTVVLDVDVDRLTTQISGVGTLQYTGTAGRHDYALSGVASLAAYALVTDTTTVNLGGQGDAQVYAEDWLNVNISGEGSVYYHGHPSVQVMVSGTGSVIDTN